MTRPLALATVLLGLTLTGSPPLAAQIRASERGAVSQTVDGTTVTIDYSRPRTRGRDSLFGGVVSWGAVWTGANWATTIDVNRDITLADRPVPAGRYSLWFEVQPDTWTLILDPEPRRFHIMPPAASDDQIRTTVATATGPHAELLTWSFHDIRPSGMVLRFAWGTTTVSLPIQVRPSQVFTTAPQVARQFVGDWTMQTQGFLGDRTLSFQVFYENDRLQAHWEGAPNPYLRTIWLAPRGEGLFYPVETEDGQLRDVLVDVVFEFTPIEGRATGFEVRGLFDQLWATGTRTP